MRTGRAAAASARSTTFRCDAANPSASSAPNVTSRPSPFQYPTGVESRYPPKTSVESSRGNSRVASA